MNLTIKSPAAICRSLLLLMMLCSISPAWGLGLGELRSNSFLGEPLDATIVISNTEGADYGPAQILVRNLQVKEASQLGIDLAGGFQRFRVIPVMDRGKLAIKLTTTDPVNEPFLNVLIELKWPTGTVYREYALLMDLKMVARSTEPSAPLADASARPSTNSTLSTELPGSEDYRVRSGDSLSKIAGRIVADTDTRRTDMMQWLLDNNPRAFVNNDPNRLLAGANLVLPASQQYPLPTAVQRPARPQPQMTAAEPELSPNRVPAAEVVDQATTKKLTIVTANISQESIMNGEPISDGNVNAMRNRLQVTNEEIDRLSRENQVMQQRLKDIEQADYVTSLERLLALKDQESKSLAEQLKQTQQDAARMTAENADLTQQVSSNSGESIGGWRFWILLLLLLLSIAGAVAFYLRWRIKESGEPQIKNAREADLMQALDAGVADNADIQSYQTPQEQAVADDIKDAFAVLGDIDDQAPASTNISNDSEGQVFNQSYHAGLNDVISEAMGAAHRGNFDVAEAMLKAERLQHEQDGSASDGLDSRLRIALEYIEQLHRSQKNK